MSDNPQTTNGGKNGKPLTTKFKVWVILRDGVPYTMQNTRRQASVTCEHFNLYGESKHKWTLKRGSVHV